jgi:hypothetical protein
VNETEIAVALADLQETLRQQGVTPDEIEAAVAETRAQTPVGDAPPIEARPFKGLIVGVPMDPDDVPNGIVTGKDMVLVRDGGAKVLKLTNKAQWAVLKERGLLNIDHVFLEVLAWIEWRDRTKGHQLDEVVTFPKGAVMMPTDNVTANPEGFLGRTRGLWDTFYDVAQFATPAPAWNTGFAIANGGALTPFGIEDYAHETDNILREQRQQQAREMERRRNRQREVEEQRRQYNMRDTQLQAQMYGPPAVSAISQDVTHWEYDSETQGFHQVPGPVRGTN